MQDEGVPIDEIVRAAEEVVSLAGDQRQKLLYHIDSPEWRTWSNPEFLFSNKGIRLDEADLAMKTTVLKVLETSLSPEGYQKAQYAIKINHFLGEICDGARVMNEHSYNFVLFGTPSTLRPWGFSFYGHHLCLNAFFYKTQIVISPWFTGAEPNEIDDGPDAGVTILKIEERLALQLMQSLPKEAQNKAQIYREMKDPSMPLGRWNHDDQRHLAGAYRDNRIIPYEGITISSLDKQQLEMVKSILNQFLLYLPQKARQMKMDHIMSLQNETYFSWIGGFGVDDPFYFRIQNSVVLVEFDHHSGVFLTNKEPAKFHIHTLMRTPNAGDYGMALRSVIPGNNQDFVWDENAGH